MKEEDEDKLPELEDEHKLFRLIELGASIGATIIFLVIIFITIDLYLKFN